MNRTYKIIGMVVSINSNHIHLNLHDAINNDKEKMIEKVIRLNEQILKKITKIRFADSIEMINIFKPIYYKYFNYNGKEIKNLHIKLTIPKTQSKKINKKELLGFTVQIYAKPSIYNFTDPQNKEKKIRGWKLQLLEIQKLK